MSKAEQGPPAPDTQLKDPSRIGCLENVYMGTLFFAFASLIGLATNENFYLDCVFGVSSLVSIFATGWIIGKKHHHNLTVLRQRHNYDD